MEQEKSMTNVLKKLSAMRVTLSNEEQKFLDKLVQVSIVEDEVFAHAAQTKVISMARPEEDEVAAHAAQTKVISMARPEEDEVVAHAAQTKAIGMARPEEDEVVAHAAQTKVSTKIVFDPEAVQYKIISI